MVINRTFELLLLSNTIPNKTASDRVLTSFMSLKERRRNQTLSEIAGFFGGGPKKISPPHTPPPVKPLTQRLLRCVPKH